MVPGTLEGLVCIVVHGAASVSGLPATTHPCGCLVARHSFLPFINPERSH
jgi:hypothetical protein